ncbi:unnamed protein product [Brassica oleracea var. botrytis]
MKEEERHGSSSDSSSSSSLPVSYGVDYEKYNFSSSVSSLSRPFSPEGSSSKSCVLENNLSSVFSFDHDDSIPILSRDRTSSSGFCRGVVAVSTGPSTNGSPPLVKGSDANPPPLLTSLPHLPKPANLCSREKSTVALPHEEHCKGVYKISLAFSFNANALIRTNHFTSKND